MIPSRALHGLILAFLAAGAPAAEDRGARETRPAVSAPIYKPAEVVKAALRFLGAPYARGGASIQGFDCSGLVFLVFEQTAGLALPRNVEALFMSGSSVKSPMHTADLVFFDTIDSDPFGTPTHVGIYAGGDRFVHAASDGTRTGVIVSSLREEYYRDRFLGARRMMAWRQPTLPITLTDAAETLVLEGPFASRETLKIVVTSRMTGGGPMELRVLREGKQTLFQRIAPTARRPVEIAIQPDEGAWTVRITRLFRGRELSNVSFTVEE